MLRYLKKRTTEKQEVIGVGKDNEDNDSSQDHLKKTMNDIDSGKDGRQEDREKGRSEDSVGVKLTFSAPQRNAVSEKIEMFQRLSAGGECVFGSGWCALHNVRLVRQLVVRRVSVQIEGGVLFEKKECVSLVCPATRQASTDDRLCDNITDSRKEERIDMPYLSEAGPANKETRITNNIGSDESIPSNQNADRELAEGFAE